MKTQVAFIVVFFSVMAIAQPFRLYQTSRGADVLNSSGDTLSNPWTGGLLAPMFNSIDVNGDGKMDLVVFESYDRTLGVYLNVGGARFRYSPDYSDFFPQMSNWVLFGDYNRDGKPDIFANSSIGAGMDVYRNRTLVMDTTGLPRFEKVRTRMLYTDVGYDLNLYVPSNDIPIICDIDGDGDLDILAQDVLQTYVQYYQNMSVEKKESPDSLRFWIMDRCWGKFTESQIVNAVELGKSCGKVIHKRNLHGSLSLLAVDLDGDGDKDILQGNLNFSNVASVENGRIKNGVPNFPLDSAIGYDTIFPRNTKAASVPYYPGMYLADIDNDGDSDLVIAPHDPFDAASKNQVLLYQNTGTRKKPVYQFVKDNFLQDNTVQEGSHSAPAFWDYDGDGLIDLAIATKGNSDIKYNYDRLLLYHNTGTKSHAVYKLVSNDFGLLSSRTEKYLSPTFGDLDHDGNVDMLIGKEDGKILYYRNTGLVGGIPQMNLVSDNFNSIDPGEYSVPTIADLDKDDLPDLLIGCKAGTISYYHNTGSKSAPVFTLVTDSFGRIHTNFFYYEYNYQNGKPVDSTLRMDPSGFSAPCVGDFDHDGKLDLVSGSQQGKVFFFMNISDSLGSRLTSRRDIFYNSLDNSRRDRNLGSVLIPAIGELNNDSVPDLLIGNYKGGLYYFSSKPVKIKEPSSIRNSIQTFVFSLYPNPADDELNISSSEPVNTVSILNSLGQTVKQVKNRFLISRIDISGLPSGVYVLQAVSINGNVASSRFVIN